MRVATRAVTRRSRTESSGPVQVRPSVAQSRVVLKVHTQRIHALLALYLVSFLLEARLSPCLRDRQEYLQMKVCTYLFPGIELNTLPRFQSLLPSFKIAPGVVVPTLLLLSP